MSYPISRPTTTSTQGGRAWVQELFDVLRPNRRPVSYDMLFKDPSDGCARSDDVWGG